MKIVVPQAFSLPEDPDIATPSMAAFCHAQEVLETAPTPCMDQRSGQLAQR